MPMTTTLLLLAAFVPNADPVPVSPQWNRGDEIVYAGEITEESTRIDIPYKRKYGIEVRVFVCEVHSESVDLAVMTLLQQREDDHITAAATIVTGVDPSRTQNPPAVRLSLVRIGKLGQRWHLSPRMIPPFRLNSDTPTQVVEPVRLDAPETLELGFILPRPEKTLTPNLKWTTPEPDRPAQNWIMKQFAVLNGTQVYECQNEQQSARWSNPGGLDTGWHRTDSVWLATGDGLARQFSRTIEIKDGVHIVEKRTVKCVMSSPPSPNRGEGYASIRKEIENAMSFEAERASGRAPGLVRRIDEFERRHHETPYRIAIEAVKRLATK